MPVHYANLVAALDETPGITIVIWMHRLATVSAQTRSIQNSIQPAGAERFLDE